jgi:transcriptional regulator with XRE-family HTH domain
LFYEKYKELCAEKGVSVSRAAEDMGIATSRVVDWKAGAIPRNSTLLKISNYFNVSISVFSDIEKATERTSDSIADDIKFALFGGDKTITDAQYDEVKRFAQFVRERDKE